MDLRALEIASGKKKLLENICEQVKPFLLVMNQI